jgi:hypothetical protein
LGIYYAAGYNAKFWKYRIRKSHHFLEDTTVCWGNQTIERGIVIPIM